MTDNDRESLALLAAKVKQRLQKVQGWQRIALVGATLALVMTTSISPLTTFLLLVGGYIFIEAAYAATGGAILGVAIASKGKQDKP